MAAEDAVNLLSIDVAAVTAKVVADAMASEKSYVESLPDDKLFAEAAAVEAELAKALAALQKKKEAAGATAAPSCEKGPIAYFECTPIDCGAVAAAAVAAMTAGLSQADVEAMISSTEAELAKAKAALERKLAAPPQTAAAPSTGSAPSTTPVDTTVSSSDSAKVPSPLRRAATSAVQLLDAAEEKTGVPKSTLVASVVTGAIALGASLLGAFSRGRK